MTGDAVVALNLETLCYAVAEASPAAIAAVDGADHIVHYVNPAFCLLAGKLRDELIGQPFVKVTPEEDQCVALLDRVLATGESQVHTGQNGSPQHSLFWSYDLSPILGADERPVGIFIRVTESSPLHDSAVAMNEALLIGSVRQHELADAQDKLNQQLQAEISLNAKAQEALIRSEKLASVGRMAAVVAHEINNPLESVTNLIYLIQTIPGLPPEAGQFLEVADAELRRIAHITRQTLGFYRESMGPETCNVASLLHSVCDLLEAKLKLKHAIVQIRCPSDLEVTGILGELRQVFSNLLVNSLDAIEAHGLIRLRASQSSSDLGDEPTVRVTIADDGHGIDAATLPRIFEPFFTTKGIVGNGLGLWVSKEIMEKHHGRMLVRSRSSGPKTGTIFTVVLPTAAPSPA